MSHSTVIVCLKAGADLEAALDPFDENKQMEPYRVYIEDWQGEYERALKFYGEHRDQLPAALDEMDVAAVLSEYMSEEVTEDAGDGSGPVLFYRMSTYNPRSRWDWYAVGGRWTGYFTIKPEYVHSGDLRLIDGMPGMLTERNADPNLCDGGPRGMLDFDAMRQKAARRAEEEFATYESLTKDLPPGRGWSHFRSRLDSQQGYTIDFARADYRSQPVIQVLSRHERYAWDCPIDEFGCGRDEFVARAIAQAVPGWALLTLDGEWIECGRMGWFGMSDRTEGSTAAYLQRANAYLEALDDDVVIVCVDVHI